MLFVHAGPAWSFVFRDVIVRLRRRFRCVALDFPGSGLSPSIPGDTPSLLQKVELALRTTFRDRPVLLVFGAQSPQLGEGFSQRWTALFSLARRLVVPRAHHFPMMDDPDLVAEAIQSLWDEVVSAGATPDSAA